MDACNKEIAVSPDDPWFYYSRAYIRLSTKDYSLCLRDLDSAISKIEARPPSNELNDFRLVCLYRRAYCCVCLKLGDRAWANVNEVNWSEPQTRRGDQPSWFLERVFLGKPERAPRGLRHCDEAGRFRTLFITERITDRVARRLREARPSQLTEGAPHGQGPCPVLATSPTGIVSGHDQTLAPKIAAKPEPGRRRTR